MHFFEEFKLSHCIWHANHGHVLMSPRRPTVEGKFKFVTAKRKSHGAISTFEMLCFLRSIQYRAAAAAHSLHCSKIDMLIQDGELDCASWKNSSKKKEKTSVRRALYQTLAYVCACVENRGREEFGVAVAHFSSFSSALPLSLRCCQSPWGRISAAAIGRPRLSKYMF